MMKRGKYHKLTEKEFSDFKKYRSVGLSMPQICELTGRSYTTVSSALKYDTLEAFHTATMDRLHRQEAERKQREVAEKLFTTPSEPEETATKDLSNAEIVRAMLLMIKEMEKLVVAISQSI